LLSNTAISAKRSPSPKRNYKTCCSNKDKVLAAL
jgi:hypothetical protein